MNSDLLTIIIKESNVNLKVLKWNYALGLIYAVLQYKVSYYTEMHKCFYGKEYNNSLWNPRVWLRTFRKSRLIYGRTGPLEGHGNLTLS